MAVSLPTEDGNALAVPRKVISNLKFLLDHPSVTHVDGIKILTQKRDLTSHLDPETTDNPCYQIKRTDRERKMCHLDSKGSNPGTRDGSVSGERTLRMLAEAPRAEGSGKEGAVVPRKIRPMLPDTPACAELCNSAQGMTSQFGVTSDGCHGKARK